jgi:hypothetical protein
MMAELGPFLGIVFVITLATGAVFFLARRAGQSDRSAVLISGMFFPIFVMLVGSALPFFGREVDDPPLGTTLLGLLMMSAVLTPSTFPIAFVLARTSFGQVTADDG